MLEAGKLPRARKDAGRWAFKPAVFLASFDAVLSNGQRLSGPVQY
jgi:hypothetical protein